MIGLYHIQVVYYIKMVDNTNVNGKVLGMWRIELLYQVHVNIQQLVNLALY